MKKATDSFLTTLAEFAPKLIGFVVILVIGLIVAKMLGKAIDRLLEKVGFDRAVERGGIGNVLEKSKFDASDVVGRLVYYALALFVLQMAFGVFGPNPISDLINRVILFLPSLAVAVVIVVVASAIAAAVKTLIEGTLGGLSYGTALANVASAFVLFLGVIAALNQVGVATTVTTPILIAILASVTGVIVVGVGGGLVKPMQARWEGYLTKAEDEVPRMRQQTAQAPSVPEQARRKADELHEEYAGAGRSQDSWQTPSSSDRRSTGY